MVEVNQYVLRPTMLFAIAGGLIVLAMLMGRKSSGSGRTSVGWWIGLGVLLVLVSGFLGFSKLRISPTVEERHTGRSALNKAMSEMRDQIESGVRAARESMQKGFDEVHKNVENAEEAINTVTSKVTSSSKRNNKSGKTPSAEISVPLPSTTVQWTVEVAGEERSQRQQFVQERLEQLGAESVNRWVNDRMPLKYYGLQLVTPAWLVDHGAFPEPIDYQRQSMDRADTDEKDTLFGGTLKVVLVPTLQQKLLEMGYGALENALQNEKFETQGIIFIILMGITGFVGILALVKTLVTRRVQMS